MITKQTLSYAAIALALTGCAGGKLSDILPDNRPDYKTSTSGNPLEVPPDLTQLSVDDSMMVSELQGTENASLKDYKNERSTTSQADALERALKNIKSNGKATWIELAAKPQDVFKQAKRFWLDNGLALSKVDASIGIMETDWLEKKTKLPGNSLTAFLSKALNGLYDDGQRDKFRTRIDFDGTNTLVYLTHYGASEEAADRNGKIIKSGARIRKDDSLDFVWVANKRNPELEVEMLRRLNLYLIKKGKQNAASSKNKKSEFGASMQALSDGTPVLVVNSDFNSAWLMLGVAIDRAGYDMSSQNRQQGRYTFAKITERKVGLIMKEIERDIDTYQVGIADNGRQQIIAVTSVNGKKPTTEQARTALANIADVID